MKGFFNGIVAVFAIVTTNNVGFVHGFLNPLATDSKEAKGPLQVGIFYETLCPDSRDFLINQVKPTVARFGSTGLVNFMMVPYGKANTTVGYPGWWPPTFQCQHGPVECERNMHHGCAIYDTDVFQAGLAPQLAACLFEEVGIDPSGDIDEATRKCAIKIDIPDEDFLEKVNSCINPTPGESSGGPGLLKMMGEFTARLNPPLHFVPWITFNGEWSKEIQDASLEDLQGTVCKHLPAIPECEESTLNFRD